MIKNCNVLLHNYFIVKVILLHILAEQILTNYEAEGYNQSIQKCIRTPHIGGRSV